MSPYPPEQGLHTQRCQPQSGAPASAADIASWLRELPKWQVLDVQGAPQLQRSYAFADYHHTMAFVNMVAWVAHQQDHHPDLEVGYNRCLVRWSTHSVGGLSINDFICAARLDALQR